MAGGQNRPRPRRGADHLVRTSYAGVGHGSPRSLSPICGVTGSSVNVRREGILDAQALPVGSTVALLHMFHPADGASCHEPGSLAPTEEGMHCRATFGRAAD